MWISSLFQTGMRKLFILGLVSSLAACGGGGGGGKKSDPVPPSSSHVSSSSSIALSSSLGSSISSPTSSSSISSLGNSSSSSTSSLVAPADTIPDSFSFPAVTGAALNANVTSAVIIISGINTAVPISIVNGEYSIDGGAFTSAAGKVSNGQTVVLRLISATTISTETQAMVTISSIAKAFSVTTINLLGGGIQGIPLNIAGVVTTLAGIPRGADGIGDAAKFSYPQGLVKSGGYLYVADTGNSKIRKIEIATGVVTTLAGSDSEGDVDGIGVAASFNSPAGITIHGNYLYVADTNNNKIRKIEMATGMVATFAGSGTEGGADGTGTAASFHMPWGITTDGVHLYVIQTQSPKIRKIAIATGVVTTLAGDGSFGSTDGPGASASFSYPRGITTDGTHLYVADLYNNKIRKIVIATGVVSTLAGSGSSGSANGVGAAASFHRPEDITVVGNHLYVADSYNNKIRKIEMATGIVTTFAGSDSYGGEDGTGVVASFRSPSGITTDGVHLYVADSGNGKIRKIEVDTSVVTTIAGSNSQGNTDGIGASASFSYPQGITTDGAHFYVTSNDKIRKIEIATRVVTTLAGSGQYGSADGTGAAASFDGPQGVTTDGTHLYVADTYNNKIRKIEIATGVVTTLAGNGSDSDADGTGAAASFDSPRGITTDGTHLYVADSDNNKIRKIEMETGVVTTLAGNNSYGDDDGTGAAASFNFPRGITTDGAYLYVADTWNDKIRKIEISTGVVSTLAGSGSSGSADGIGTAAQFYSPAGITTDGANLYVADAINHKIRKIEVATGVVTTLAGSDSIGSADGVGTVARFREPTGITTDGFALYVTDAGNNTIRKIE